jgi:type I restriction enzyme R subunit
LQKLRRNKPLTATDIQELESILAAAAIGTSADIDRAREGDGLGVFVRSLVGLDRDAATDALSAFVNGRVLSADQHDFVALVVEHLTTNGTMAPELLYEPPFTDIAIGGPEGLFADAEVSVLISVIDGIRANAVLHGEVA